MSYSGIDVSKHNGKINWSALKGKIDFVMIRAGYGKNHIDEQLYNNIHGCRENNIDFGLYWFSYAVCEKDAYNEAEYICNLADVYHPVYPIAYDWEYDSDNYAKRQGYNITNAKRTKFAKIFLERVKERGYTPINYTNVDYLDKGFSELTNQYDLWLASWTKHKPIIPCDIWQNSSTGIVPGINGKVDSNICYKDYKNNVKKEENKMSFEEKVNLYLETIKKVINGEYGNGEERKRRLEAEQFDFKVIQDFLNSIHKML